ncbi:MAG: discoidin domain-containing protein [Opitutaceae bacterium]|jgi:hypothetical protein|nr:discoidin domain-containing protein [Opitutaceae bacterium]
MTHRILRLLATASGLLACAFVGAAITPADLPPGIGPNLALNKPFESSDVNKSRWDSGVTDGSWTAARGTTYASGNSAEFPKTLTIDLQKAQDVAHVLVGTPSFGSTKSVTVSLSTNGRKFTNVGSNDFLLGRDDNHLFSFKPAKARYVRLTFTENHAEKSGTYTQTYCFITEVEVFGASGGPTQSNLGNAGAGVKADPRRELPRARLPRNLGPNLALSKPYECDDKNMSGWDGGLTDGLWAMRSGATFATARAASFPKNVTIDLRVSAKLTHVYVGVPDFGSTKTVAVSVSYDGKNFTEVGRHDFPFAKPEARLFEFAPVLARHVRLTYLGNHTEKKGFDPAYCFTTEVEAYAQE